MPADAEELEQAMADGVQFLELVAPVGGRPTASSDARRCSWASRMKRAAATHPHRQDGGSPCDTVISAVGERVDTEVYTSNGIEVDSRGRAMVNADTLESNVKNVFVSGDAMRGPATVVEGIADATRARQCRHQDFDTYRLVDNPVNADYQAAIAKRGILCNDCKNARGIRCLSCAIVCEVCTDVCPNRANVAVRVPGKRMRQIIHVDGMCNECGNCAIFCPYDSAPYREKFTLFLDGNGFSESEKNDGFLPLSGSKVLVRLKGRVMNVDLDQPNDLPADVEVFILTVLTKYRYLLG